MQRAYRPKEKEARRRSILAGAVALLRETPYSDLRMTDLARRLGLGKGTLYLYFPTKESLFLAVLQTEMGAWFEGAATRLAAAPAGSGPAALAAELVQELLERPLLPQLQALLHGVLEQNLPLSEAHAFARFLHAHVLRVGERLEAALPGLAAGQGAGYLIRFHGLVIGAQLMSSRPPAVREALVDPDMNLFNFSFASVMGGAAADLLQGMLRSG